MDGWQIVTITSGKRFEEEQRLIKHRSLKCKLYRSLVRPVANGWAAWCMTEKDEPTLLLFESRHFRSIFGEYIGKVLQISHIFMYVDVEIPSFA